MSVKNDLQKIEDIKIDIYNAILEKDVSLANNAPLENYSQAILSISGGGGSGSTPGIELYDSTKTYRQNKIVLNVANDVVKIYQSLVNNNTSALTDTTKWKEILANTDLSNLSSTGNDVFVTKNTAQTISAIKTFTASPVVPAPTNNTDAATKKYVDDTLSAIETALASI